MINKFKPFPINNDLGSFYPLLSSKEQDLIIGVTFIAFFTRNQVWTVKCLTCLKNFDPQLGHTQSYFVIPLIHDRGDKLNLRYWDLRNGL